MAKNFGENDEMRAKLHLIQLRGTKKTITIGGNEVDVLSVRNGEEECKPLPEGTDLAQLSDLEVESLAKQVGAFKAPAGSKADVYVNDLGISVKSHRGANPAFLNHTHRAGFLKVCERVGVSINKLDKIISDYWIKRKAGDIGEDVKNSDPKSPFKKHLDYLKPIMNYFLFTGTAQKDSPYPADYILDFTDPLDESSWKFSKDEYLDDNWEHIIFSVRSKGMPDSYPNGKDATAIKPWVEYADGKYKGSLHGRAQF
ncbi:hypothetical protein [Hoylesella loescheii]|jgi:hypothetical protein|uniref:hypothetical protein n=1 Tax=Hoylesella loescheii TaxID=840 RepID=UPI0026ECA393|nr:hypothetical protein [Hoylesella loescheii]